jgi:hypothetical protein
MLERLKTRFGASRAVAREAQSPASTSVDYRGLLAEMAKTVPRAVHALDESARLRLRTLSERRDGARLAGVNDLLLYLDETARRYAANATLAKIEFLVRRACADFETALEATASGYIGVAADAMRDVLEIEYLLLDFVAEPDHVELWLEGSNRGLFLPRELRKRLRAAGVGEFTHSVAEGADYAAHSAALHVSPRQPLIGHKGRAPDPWEIDAGFWEMFEHARRIILALEACGLALGGDEWTGAGGSAFDLSRIADAHRRTQEMQTMYVAMLEGPAIRRKQLGREPTTADLLRYVRDQLADE